MKPETLEALVLDRALGELPPATVELLDAYLEQNPAAALSSAALVHTVRLARSATARPCATHLPTPRWQSPAIQVVRFPSALRWVGLAACLTLAATLGWYAGRPANPDTPSAAAQARAGNTLPPSTPVAHAADLPHPEHALSASIPDKKPYRYRLVWDSPLKRPTIEDKP